ncbi:hypothetical protein BKI52_24250 [marine bacterium AO1-C]|nr:hypothetical protein BKI52_24250 [marine bacterium AO1-C]
MQKQILFIVALFMFALAGCQKDDSTPSNGDLTLNLTGLDDLGSDFVYEGWVIVGGAPVSTGTFTVNSSGALSSTTFSVSKSNLDNATGFVLSIEPANDPDPAPSAVKILSGDFSGNTANVNITSIVGDFSSSSGKYFLATPTDGNQNPLSGVWFIDNSTGTNTAGLKNLPTLGDGWVYEGWAVINGTPVSTGTFKTASGADMGPTPTFSGPMGGPAYPGEDFLMNAPTGLTFPTNLSGATIVVSVEPVPDNSSAPFTLKPLTGMVPATAMGGTNYSLAFSATSFPTGSVSR